MGRYEGPAQEIAKRIAAVRQQKAAQQRSIVETANGMVGDLGEFAADLNSALKQAVPDFDGQVDAIPWRQEGNAIIGTLSLRSDGQNRDIRVIVPIGNGDVTVGGTAVRRGDSPMNVLYTEVVRILNPGS